MKMTIEGEEGIHEFDYFIAVGLKRGGKDEGNSVMRFIQTDGISPQEHGPLLVEGVKVLAEVADILLPDEEDI